ncbi:MAG: hypothetical protein WC777_02880 [Candidatus Gracilibacteria bacterium]|jgi:hypothetical protein
MSKPTIEEALSCPDEFRVSYSSEEVTAALPGFPPFLLVEPASTSNPTLCAVRAAIDYQKEALLYCHDVFRKKGFFFGISPEKAQEVRGLSLPPRLNLSVARLYFSSYGSQSAGTAPFESRFPNGWAQVLMRTWDGDLLPRSKAIADELKRVTSFWATFDTLVQEFGLSVQMEERAVRTELRESVFVYLPSDLPGPQVVIENISFGKTPIFSVGDEPRLKEFARRLSEVHGVHFSEN